ncbi:MAG: gliding motility-associated C-terminal domain-containing protein [Bacteroidota bacterium]|jgi:gliding motility-associated-like protein
MKANKLHILFPLLFLFSFIKTQTVIWTENFNNGCTAACTAVGYNGVNGAWTQSVTGTEGADPNAWYVSCAENNQGIGNCGAGCGSNQTLHISAALGNFICPNDCGAAYDAGGLCGILSCPQTDRRIESPSINLTGQSNVTLSFAYIEQGQGTTDNCTIWYFDGTTWSFLFDTPATNNATCGGQGLWTLFTIPLPASANNNPNVKIGFRWVNNDDGAGADPSVAIDDVTLTVPGNTPLPVPTFTVTSPVCQGTSLSLNGTSTNSPLLWQWSVAPAGPVIANPSAQNTNILFISPNTYTITLTVSNAGGSNSVTQTVTVDPEPVVVVTPNPVVICGGASQNLTASGANSYLWSPSTGLSQTTGASVTATPTANISYTVIGISASGNCDDTVTVPVTVSASITASASATSTVICSGGSTTLTGSGGANYSWAPPAGLSCTNCQSPVASPTVNTTYSLTVSSGTSCPTASTTISVSVTPGVVATASASNTNICAGNSTTLNGSGGGTYSWSPPTGLSCTNCQSPVASPTNTTTYTVTVTNGTCAPATASVTINVNPATIASATASQSVICSGQTTSLNASGGGTYSWSPSTGLSCTNCQNPIATPTGNITYTVSVVNGTCLAATATVGITVNNCVPPVASFTSSQSTFCTGDCINFINTSTGSPTTVNWQFIGGSASPSTSTSNSVTVCFYTPGTYTVQLNVSNSSGSAVETQTIFVAPLPIANVYPSLDTIPYGTSTVLVASSGDSLYNWTPASSVACSTCSLATVTPTSDTWYYCTQTNEYGCSAVDSALVIVDIICGDVFVPSAFSPNGDYNNDVLKVRGNCLVSMTFLIFDRWGEKVFESENPSIGWDGTFKSKPLDTAVFFYQLTAKTADGKTHELKGDITLIR